MMVTKYCIFGSCNNTSVNTPEKIFLSVPPQSDRRTLWFEAAGKTKVPKGRNHFCCEDHFNLEEDAENWMYFKMMGQHLILKKDVVPRPSSTKDVSSQLTPRSKKRKLEIMEELKDIRRELFSEEKIDPSIATKISDQFFPSVYVEKSPTKLTVHEGERSIIYKWTKTKDSACVTRPQTSEKENDNTSTVETDVHREPSYEYFLSSPLNENMDNIVTPETLSIALHKIELHPRLYLALPEDSFFIIKSDRGIDEFHPSQKNTKIDKEKETPFEFVACECNAESFEGTEGIMNKPDATVVKVKEEVLEDEFENQTVPFIKTENEQNTDNHLTHIRKETEDVALPTAINSEELIIKDEIIEEEL